MRALLAATLALPLAAQWDLRLEVPFPKGQNLPQTLLSGSGQLLSGELDTGRGAILSLNRSLVVFGPVLRLEAGLEVSRFQADGPVRQGPLAGTGHLRQVGAGVALNAQFWVPFTGVAGEFGLIQRLQTYRFDTAGAEVARSLARTWLRAGLRARVPGLPVYLVASYQEPVTRSRPVQLASAADLAGYLSAQGSGQEFERLWTFGAGMRF